MSPIPRLAIPATILVGLACAVLISLLPAATAHADVQPPPQCVDNVDNDGDGVWDFDDVDTGNSPETFNCDTDATVQGGNGGGGGGFGEDCDGATDGVGTIANVVAKKPGQQDWQPFEGQCAIQEGQAGAFVLSFVDPSNASFPQDLSNLYPQGSEISADLTFSGASPLFVLATGRDMKADVGSPMTVQGTVPKVEFAREFLADGGPDCGGVTDQIDFYGIVVQFDDPSSPFFNELMSDYAGAVIGTNAQTISFGGVQANGTFDTQIAGCGDLFYEAYLPSDGLALGGLTKSLAQQLASQLGDQVADQGNLTKVSNDGDNVPSQQFDSEFVSPGDIQPEPTQGSLSSLRTPLAGKKKVAGVAIDYGSGSGSHDVAGAPRKKGVTAAKKAVKKCKKLKRNGRKAKLKVKNGKVVCKKKTRRHA